MVINSANRAYIDSFFLKKISFILITEGHKYLGEDLENVRKRKQDRKHGGETKKCAVFGQLLERHCRGKFSYMSLGNDRIKMEFTGSCQKYYLAVSS